MRNFKSPFDDDDLLDTKDNRNSTINRPDIDPGMSDDDDDDWKNIGSSSNDSPWGSSSGNDDNDDSPFSGFSGFNGMGRDIGGISEPRGFNTTYGSLEDRNTFQNNTPTKSYEDTFYAAIGSIFKKIGTVLKGAYTSWGTFDINKRVVFGRNTIFSSAVLLVLALIGIFMNFKGSGNIFLGSGIALAIGIPFFMSNMQRKTEMGFDDSIDDTNDENMDYSFNSNISEIDNNEFLKNQIDKDEDEDFDIPNFNIETDIDVDNDIDSNDNLFSQSVNFEDLDEKHIDAVNPLDVIREMNSNMQNISRQYLYESIVCCLKNLKSNFSDGVKLDEDSREFLSYCKMVDDAGELLTGSKPDDCMALLEVEDKLFYTRLEISRPKWFKQETLKNLITEIVAICSYDKKKGKKDENCTGTGYIVGNRIIIKIMKGASCMISIKDTYDVKKNDILDMANKIPIILGVDEDGEVVLEDFDNVYSLLVTGRPRSGKSWLVKAIIFQLLMLAKPSDINLYIGDAKDTASDYYFMDTPHIKQFASTDEEILDMVRFLVKVEAPRRKQVFMELGGYKNIKDVRKNHPNVEMPYIYLLIDEVVTLADRMDKDTKVEFQGLLRELTTQLPSFGVRPFLVPHELKDDIIKKSITDMIPCRVSVGGNAALIENATNAKPSEFPYKLSAMGDMAVRCIDNKMKFVHAAVLSETDKETDDLFRFLTLFWLKVMPKSFYSSRLERDIKNHTRVVDTSSFPEEVISMIEEVQKQSLSVNRPTRNKIEKLENTTVLIDNDDKVIEEPSDKIEKKSKINFKTTEKKVSQLNSKKEGSVLNSEEIQKSLDDADGLSDINIFGRG